MQFQQDSDVKSHLTHIDTEVASGALITRRQVVWLLSLAAITGTAFGGTRRRWLIDGNGASADLIRQASEQGGSDPHAVERIVREVLASEAFLTESLRAEEERYVAGLARRLLDVNATRFNAEELTTGDAYQIGGGVLMRRALRIDPIIVYRIDMQPRAMIRLHDHRNYNGAITATAGGAQVSNFDVCDSDGAYDENEFLIAEAGRVVLAPGRSTWLSGRVNNIHEIEASGSGAVLLDAFTVTGPGAKSYELEVEAKPLDPRTKIYRASWLGPQEHRKVKQVGS